MRKNNSMGKVWLVGAGPSDVGLLTLKGKEVLKKADVVVYDSLAGIGIMNLVSEKAECIYVGKRAGNHTMPQEEINQILVSEAKKGKKVVRLKGGDPFLFGRGGEELEGLVEKEIPFEIVPGVTSAISVPAYNGIPVTHRDCTSSLHIITGHKKSDETCDVDFEALVRMNGTLVFLMGFTALEEICQGLLNARMRSSMPAALLQQGTSAGQKKILATVGTLAEAVKKQPMEPPAIIVIGEVCSYGEKFGWYEKLPLFGKRIVVTRPKERSFQITEKLRELGAEVIELPTIKPALLPNNEYFLEEMKHLGEYNYLVFTSPTGVRIFFDTLKKEKIDIRSIGNAKIAVVGLGTYKEVEKRGLIPEQMPEIYNGKELGRMLGTVLKDGDKILIPRAKEGNKELVKEILKQKKVTIVDLPIYEIKYETRHPWIQPKVLFEQGKISMAVFTSASTVRGFVESTKGLDYSLVQAACIGEQTKAQADKMGMQTFAAKEATIESLVELVKECGKKGGC